MKIKFEDEEGVLIHETESNILLPKTDDLVYLKNQLFVVMYLCYDYDKNIVEVNMETQ